MAVGVFPVG